VIFLPYNFTANKEQTKTFNKTVGQKATFLNYGFHAFLEDIFFLISEINFKI